LLVLLHRCWWEQELSATGGLLSVQECWVCRGVLSGGPCAACSTRGHRTSCQAPRKRVATAVWGLCMSTGGLDTIRVHGAPCAGQVAQGARPHTGMACRWRSQPLNRSTGDLPTSQSTRSTQTTPMHEPVGRQGRTTEGSCCSASTKGWRACGSCCRTSSITISSSPPVSGSVPLRTTHCLKSPWRGAAAQVKE
jgi:hypothetical protein